MRLLLPLSPLLALALAGCSTAAIQENKDAGRDTADSGDTGDSGDSGWDSADSGDSGDTGGDSGALPEEAGQSAGSRDDATSGRLAFDAEDPVEEENPGLLLYAAEADPQDEPLDDLSGAAAPEDTPNQRYAGAPAEREPWSSATGIAASAEHVTSDHVSNWPLPEGREVCVPPELVIDCCSYTLTEGAQDSGDTQTYYSPGDYFYDEANAGAFLSNVYAQIPFFLPFTDADVKLWQGWEYGSGGAHGSVDYGQSVGAGEDPSFRVRAAASGVVVAKYWDNWHGNVLVLEHPGPAGGFDYRTFYFHLRDGQTHDVTMARDRTVPTGDPDSSRDKYALYAAGTPDPLQWGTEAQTILVDVGDTVYAGQQIAWSGNTGPGGAGNGLGTDGVPTSASANNHLHFMMAVRHDDLSNGDWVYVDPYGVYQQAGSGCYDLLQNTDYDRMLAPFYPYFHEVELGVYNYYLYYYGQMGRTPATLSVQRTDGGELRAAGAMKSGLGSDFAVLDYVGEATWTPLVNNLADAGFRQVERSITLDGGGTPRFNAIFRPDDSPWASYGELTVDEYLDAWDQHVDGEGLDLVDFFGYTLGGEDRIAVVFAEEPGTFAHHAYVDSATFTTLANDYADDGWLPVDVNVMEMSDGVYLSGIFRKTGDSRMVHWGMSSAQYQQWMDWYLSQGWDLVQVQSYAEGTRFAAIWASGG